MPAKRTNRPARRAYPPSAPTPGIEHPAIVPLPMVRYRVLSGGVSTPAGPAWHGEIVEADRLGDAARVKALLDRKSIEEVANAAD